jgi:hypothetical protein
LHVYKSRNENIFRTTLFLKSLRHRVANGKIWFSVFWWFLWCTHWIRARRTKDYEMRKGFTREPQRDEPASPGKNYITRSGLQRLKDEHRFLLTRERPAVTEVVAWAASNGDRSENADYQYGKRRLPTAILFDSRHESTDAMRILTAKLPQD